MQLKQILETLPKTKGCVIILSGGLDSTIGMRLCVEKYGAENVTALTFDYGQKQKLEITRAKESTELLKVEHIVADLQFYGMINQGFSANVDKDITTPTIHEALGDPQPLSYLANRNMVMLSIAAALAETRKVNYIFCGLQVHDTLGYHDTTQNFVNKINDVLSLNRKNKIQVIAPFVDLSKTQELDILIELDGNINLMKHTLTCYNPQKEKSCANCAACSERIQAFMNIKQRDPIPYVKNIPWQLV